MHLWVRCEQVVQFVHNGLELLLARVGRRKQETRISEFDDLVESDRRKENIAAVTQDVWPF